MLVSIFDGSYEGSNETLGGKGYGLWWMQQQGVNVPPALIIPTSVCVEYMKSPKGTMKKIASALYKEANFFKAIFGYQPLLSVRSGARVSMPGMMDTILNVGLDTKSMTAWEQRLGTECVMDSYKRLITMYGNVVKGIERKKLECETLPECLAAYQRAAEEAFPSATDQLLNSIEAVFKSWNNDRAKYYRKMNNIPEEWGTAVVIQAMVFGNLNDNSGTGVLFTRDADTGANEVVGEFLMNAQGEDVVAGIRTPINLSKLADWNAQVSVELIETVTKLEALKKDVQDVEFTIMDGKLYILQTRNAKRSAAAAVKIALDMVDEGLITQEQAMVRVTERELDLAEQPVIDPKFKTKADFTGLPACSGVQTGIICLSSTDAINMAKVGQKVILVTEETTPDDIGGMHAAVGVLTMTGGSTSHAAVVARSMNRTCIVGLGKDFHSQFKAGEKLSLDGATGRVWFGEVPVVGGSNPLVKAFRSAKVFGQSMLVERAPAFHVKHLVLELGNSLHLTDGTIMQIAKDCAAMCDTMSLSFTQHVSDTFYSKASLEARRTKVFAMIFTDMKIVGSYGEEHGNPDSVAVGETLTLEQLVMAKSSVYVQSIAKKWGKAEKKVIAWLAKDGVAVGIWNTPEATSPKSYSVIACP